ncbi:hypothetical protein BSKO_04174 [Bryopsis sp. KO-2023]|nr:hypothetical protein BSKO_04174 [Bryopsis sp. KO-2023]
MSHFAIIHDGGIVLLARTLGEVARPPSATLALLGALSSFAETSAFALDGIETTDMRVTFQKFQPGFLFVLATKNRLLGQGALLSILQSLYDFMVLLLGHDLLGLSSSTEAPTVLCNADRIKQHLQGISPLLESMLGEIYRQAGTPLPKAHCIDETKKRELVAALEKLGKAAQTSYVCLITSSGYVAATEGWLTLERSEMFAIQELIRSKHQKAELFESLVHLSIQDFKTALRLITCDISHLMTEMKGISRIWVAMICGRQPAMIEVKNLIQTHLQGKLLNSIQSKNPDNDCVEHRVLIDSSGMMELWSKEKRNMNTRRYLHKPPLTMDSRSVQSDRMISSSTRSKGCSNDVSSQPKPKDLMGSFIAFARPLFCPPDDIAPSRKGGNVPKFFRKPTTVGGAVDEVLVSTEGFRFAARRYEEGDTAQELYIGVESMSREADALAIDQCMRCLEGPESDEEAKECTPENQVDTTDFVEIEFFDL